MIFSIQEPYKPLWLTIPLILGLSIIGYNGFIDIQYHDTYFVIASIHLGIFFSTILFFNGLLYWFMRNKALVLWMTLFHVICTISVFFMITLASFYFRFFSGEIADFLIFILMALSQVIFLLNLAFSLLRNKPRP